MERDKIIAISFQVARLLCFLGLAFWLVYFVKDIWSDFYAKKTSERVYTERSHFYEHPAITICFDPLVNPNALNKYNMTVTEFLDHNKNYYVSPNASSSLSMHEFVQDVGYKFGRDFNISFGFWNKSKILRVELNGRRIPLNMTRIMKVKEIITIANGLCYIISIDKGIKSPLLIPNRFDLKFEDIIKPEDLPHLEIFLTSKHNAYGTAIYQFYEGDRFHMKMNPMDRMGTRISVKKQVTKQLPETSNCTSTSNLYACWGLKTLTAFKKHPNTTCLPLKYSVILPMTEFKENWKICQTPAEELTNTLIYRNDIYLNQNSEIIRSCPTSCKKIRYKGEVSQLRYMMASPYWVAFEYIFPSNLIEGYEEYLMFSLNDFIGTIGGHSGLFIGFSFFGLVAEFLSLIQRMF